MNHILSLQSLTIDKQDDGAGLAASSESNNCGNGNSGLSVVCLHA